MSTVMHLNFRNTAMLVLSMILSGCAGSDDDLNRYIHQTKMKKSRPIESVPEIAEPEKFKYPENLTRRSPFKAVVKHAPSQDALAPDQNRPKMPLEKFPLDSLKFVGTLKDGTVKWGLITEPDGKVVRVKSGDYMGQNYGKILRISDDALLLQETIKVSGKWEKKKTTFKLKSEN